MTLIWDSQICYFIQLIKCALRKLNAIHIFLLNIWAHTAEILFVLKTRFKIERREDNGFLEHDAERTTHFCYEVFLSTSCLAQALFNILHVNIKKKCRPTKLIKQGWAHLIRSVKTEVCFVKM